jgi:hypothetical protein
MRPDFVKKLAPAQLGPPAVKMATQTLGYGHRLPFDPPSRDPDCVDPRKLEVLYPQRVALERRP